MHKEARPSVVIAEDNENRVHEEVRADIDAGATSETGVEAVAKKPRLRAKPKYAFPIPVAAVALDFDGTLVDSIDDLTEAVNRMRTILGFAPLATGLVKTFVGKGIAHLVDRALADAVGQLGPTAHKVALEVFEKYYGECCTNAPRVFPGVLEGLDALREAGLHLACITNKPERFTLALLQKTGLKDYFEMVVCGDSVAQKKPHPLPMQHIAKNFEISADRLLLIGDSVIDAETARAAGSPVFIVTYGYGGQDEIRGLDCDAYVDLLPAALKLIKMTA